MSNSLHFLSLSQEWVDLFLSFGKPLNFLALVTFLVGLLTAVSVLRTIDVLKEKLGIAPEPKKAAWWSTKRIMKTLTDATPVGKENDIMLDHDYDGIKELDNALPPWWLYGFYLTIAMSVVYMGYYHLGSGPSSIDEFQADMAQVEAAKAETLKQAGNNIDENSVVLLSDASALAEGKKLYDANCVACHAADGGGLVGPNLTDAYWIHGGSVKDVFSIIKYGVLEKGMISWQEQLNPSEMQAVSSYILNFQGTTPAVPKEAQGVLFSAETTPAVGDSAL